ncbi:ATP-binding cassette domain-containing protein [Pseudofulvibacter geojedonensis]
MGKCSRCNGIGNEEQIDLNKLVQFPQKTIREGALAPTLPNGYIMYSQVTIDVLNQVCEAEGFDVDIPWCDLTKEQQDVILYGSNKIKVPFGKHSLESRLKWTGIKAKPREEGYYKGMIPIMSDILRRDRNANILKYVHAVTCPDCKGTRLNDNALSVNIQGKNIATLSTLELNELKQWILSNSWNVVGKEIMSKIVSQIDLLEDLGLGHLTIDRPAKSLRASEIQRIRIANQILVPLSNVLYVFDEPSIGLHPEENERLIYHFKELVKKGNTVLVVEHDLDTIKNADHIIEIGPKAGVNGGELLFNGSFSNFLSQQNTDSPTFKAIKSSKEKLESKFKTNSKAIRLLGCSTRNLKNINVSFQLGKLNVVSGKSGVGKSSLVKDTLLNVVQQHLGIETEESAQLSRVENIEAINKLIFIDHSPIGKTPRSNPATYLGLSNHIRDIYAKLPEAKALGFTKSRFSFNNKGGRCEECQGSGKTQIGMHFLGNVDLVCGTCNGNRFNEATLQIKYKGLSIAEVYKLSVNEAIHFFSEDTSTALSASKKLIDGLLLLQNIGLGYLTLGQSSTTLSGGEAQRIKIANQLQKKDTGNTLYIIIEPSIGLHYNDIKSLLQLFDVIKEKGNTIVCIEQDETIIGHSDWHIELGPKSGQAGGNIVYQGIPKEQVGTVQDEIKTVTEDTTANEIILNGVTTHGLKNIDVRIPKNQLTVVTGVSGSGKSSLVYDTLFAESNARFTESLSTYNRSFLKQNSEAEISFSAGLTPAIGINRKGRVTSKRSTVGTLSGVYDAFRLLYSRIAQEEGKAFTAQHFSFNYHLGACPDCQGMGVQRTCNPDSILVNPSLSILNGAISTNKAIGYYANINGQFIATLKEVAKQQGWNINTPWVALDDEIKQIILYGTGDAVWDVTWEFTTKSRTGVQELSAKWLGFCNYIDDEYERKKHNKNIVALEEVLHHVECASCNGSRLQPKLLETQFLGKSIHELTQLNIAACLDVLTNVDNTIDEVVLAISKVVLPSVKSSLQTLVNLGLGYLSLDRAISSLSGGERQRVTLAGQLATHLFGVTYVLDEPTIGLDDAQVEVLSEVLQQIVRNGNTVVVVEHNDAFIKKANYVIEMGPAAGRLGGEVIYQGTIAGIAKAKNTQTYKLLYEKGNEVAKAEYKKAQDFGVKGAFANNLKHIDVTFNSGQLIAVTGVSGSGKSSLIKEVLYQSWLQKRAVNCNTVFGLEQFDEVLLVDQQAINQNRLSTVVSYTGILDQLKIIFSKTEQAKKLGLKKADFSYQSKNGKCTTCNGYGKLKISMDFMSDLWLTCDACKGKRYNESVLSCSYKNQSIGDILNMTVQEAIAFFEGEKLEQQLEILNQVGVGHLLLGQSLNTLSGGEGQRLKLAHSMLQKKKEKTLYWFDEPSTGLHQVDIHQLLRVFHQLIGKGNTILFIEHNQTFIQAANQMVRLGPGSGHDGGRLF